MGMLGEQSLTVTRRAAGSYTNGVYTHGSESELNIRGALQPLKERELQMLPEGWRTKARWKLYTKTRLKGLDAYAATDADRVQWPDPSVTAETPLVLMVIGLKDYSNTPSGMTLKHYKYALLEQEVAQ